MGPFQERLDPRLWEAYKSAGPSESINRVAGDTWGKNAFRTDNWTKQKFIESLPKKGEGLVNRAAAYGPGLGAAATSAIVDPIVTATARNITTGGANRGENSLVDAAMDLGTIVNKGFGTTKLTSKGGELGDQVFQYFRPDDYARNRLESLPKGPVISPMQQQQKEAQLQRDLYANAPLIDPEESRRLERERNMAQQTDFAAKGGPFSITNKDGTTRVNVGGGYMEFDNAKVDRRTDAPIGLRGAASADMSAGSIRDRARRGYDEGTYAPRTIAPEEQMRRNMIATQAGISPDYVPVAERVNEINRQTRAVRDLRASNMGLNPELFDLAGGDASQARRYQRAMEAAIARGAPVMGGPGGGGRGGGLGQAYGDAWEAAAKAKTPESLLSKKGAEFLNAGTDPTQPQTQAAMNIMAGMGREPTAPESIALANQMAALNRGFVQQDHPLAASPGMVSSLESAEGAWYNPMNWFRDATYYKGKTRSGKPFETGYGYNPYLEEAALGFRPPR